MKYNKKDTHGKEVLLLFPPLREHIYGDKWKLTESTTAPLGLMYLATPLVNAGYKVNFIDFTVDKLEKEQYFNILKNADFILITCLTQTFKSVKKIINDIRSVNKNTLILCGGPYCNETENYVEGSDLTVFGEADLVIVKILDLISSKKSLDGIPGLSYRKNGKLIRNPGTLLIENLDFIEPPSFELAKNKNYGYLYGVKINAMTAMITSRGCPFRCTFCNFRGIKYRVRSVDKVIQEIKIRLEEEAEYIIFHDDNFLLRRNRVIELMDEIIENKFNLKIAIVGRVDLADYVLYKKLKEAGVIIIIYGIESANQDVLDFYNKKTTVEKTKKAIAIANKVGIITYGNIIIGAPIEKKRHFEVNKKFLKEVPLDFLNVHILQYACPSALWNDLYKKGLINENEIVVTANKKLSNFSKEELMKVQDELIKSFYNNPKRILRLTYKISRNFGVSFIFKLLNMFFSKTIYRSAEKFHDFVVKDVRL
ncbi:radical SAM protein [candidate division KSB1 bacterium]|nr:radical SAM protein [candidate division KSB1 bacterium]